MGLFKVSEMSCGHCEKAIKSELTKGDEEVKIEVNLKAKTVKVENLSDDRVMFLLREIGYEVEQVK
jgi:copper chaperone